MEELLGLDSRHFLAGFHLYYGHFCDGAYWHTCVNKCLCGDPDVSMATLTDKPIPSDSGRADTGVPSPPIAEDTGEPTDDASLDSTALDSTSLDSSTATTEEPPAEESPAAEEEKGLNNRTLYAEFGKMGFKDDPGLDSYADELKAYLDAHPETTVTITGHTDDVGSERINLSYGKRRAMSVRRFFVRKGITKSRIEVDSKGESQPIADNATEEGRAKNRRIYIVLTPSPK